MPVNINKRNDVNSVNGQTGDVVLTANDVNALPDTTNIPNKTSDLTNDSYFVSDENYVHTDNNYTTEEKNSVATIGDKVDKVEGKGLSTNDLTDDLKSDYDNAVLKIHEHSNKVILDNTTASYTTEEQSKLNGIENGAEVNTVTGVKGDAETEYRTGNINITRENIGLENVANERQWSDNNHPTTVNGYGITDAATSEELQSETTRATVKENEIVKNLSIEISRATNAESEISTNLSSHINNISNPHNVTKNQIGLDNVENKSSDTIRSEITKDNVTSALGYTPYTPTEVDNMISSLETNIDWKESVATYDDIAITYPNPVDGWTVNVKDTDYTYRYNGTSWVAISANAIPKATNSVDGLLSKEDHTNYDDANSKKHTHENKSVLDGITDTLVSNWNSAKTHADSTHARTDATKVEKSTTNGNILINGTETNVYTHPSGTNPHGTTKSDVGLSNVPNVSTNDQTPSYTEVTTLEKLSSGEKLSVAFGKISKAITDLISHISDSVKHITSTERTNWDAAKTHADSAHAPSDAQVNVIETVKVNGTALTPNSKAVDVIVPTKVSQLTNDSGFKTTDNNTTYSLSKSGSTITLTGSDGSTTSVADSNTTYSTATTSSNGLMSSTDKSKLDGIESGAQKNTVTGIKGNSESSYRTGNVNITPSNIGLGNVGNFKAVSTVADQGLTDTEKSNARTNIGAGTSSFTGSYNDLSDKPTIPSVGNGTITITQNGTTKGTFTTNQSGNTTIELTDNNTTYNVATQSANGLESAFDKKKLDGIATGAEVNQNAFSNVIVGSTTISADSKTDSLTLAGSNVTLTPDADNDKVTIGITKANVTSALGYTPPTTNTTYSEATTDASGLMSKSDKSKLDGITASADSVSFSRNLTSGTKVGTITINGTGTDLYAPTNTDTHYTTGLKVGDSNTATTNAAATNGNVYLNVLDNTTVRDSHKIVGSGATTVTSDANGVITISSTDNNTTYGVATSSALGLVKSGTDITVDSSGNVSVNDDSHNHVISNVDGLQSALDGKLERNTSGGIATCSGNGKYKYFKIATIKITSSHINRPIVFEMSGRGRCLSLVTIEFSNADSTDPTLSFFTSNCDNCFWIKKTTTSTWEVYGQYSESWGYHVIHRITGAGADIGVTVNMTNIDSLPSGCTQVAYGGNVNYANSSSSATKATQDESGNNIKSSYASSISISDHTITLKNKNGASLGTVTVPDNNTWRGIQNNLTSDSTTDSLSAAQGKVLKGLVDGKAASNHTHSNYMSSIHEVVSSSEPTNQSVGDYWIKRIN